MHKLKLLFKNNALHTYRALIESANLPNLTIADSDDYKADIVFGEPTLIRDELSALTHLSWAQSSWAGIEPLLSPSLRKDYLLTNARGVFGDLMSEFVFAYLLMHERKILQRLSSQENSTWNNTPPGTLRGKTIGILGVGSIGAQVAKTAKNFGMHVFGYSRQSETCPYIDQYFHGAKIYEFCRSLNILVNLLPNTTATSKIINQQFISSLPKNSIFINAGRASTVDQNALLEAIMQEHFSMVVLDVFEQEPLPTNHPLWRSKNVYISSHTAAPSIPEDICKLFIENYHHYITNQPLKYQVDFDLEY